MHLRALVLLACLAIPATASATPLVIMAEDASEPFSRHDGTGYANDLVRAAFKAAGIDARLDVVPYARCKKSLEEGSTPACFSMSWLPEFKSHIMFSDQPLFQVQVDVYRNRANIVAARELPSGSTLGIINGYEYPDSIYALAGRGVMLERNSSEAANLKMLASGRIDAAVMMTSEFENMRGRLRFLGVEKSVAFAFRAGTMKSYIGFSRINPRGEEARQAFNKGYAIIVANHTRDRIRESWMKQIWR